MKRRIIIGLIFCFFWSPCLLWAEDSGGIIIFRAKVAADQYYQTKSQNWQKDGLYKTAVIKNDGWKDDLIDLTGCVNRKFEEQGIKVKFEIAEIVNWQTEEKITSMIESLEDLEKKISLGNCDLVIGLTAKMFSKEGSGGLFKSQNYILVKDYSLFVLRQNMLVRENKSSWALATLLHEIGHYFLGLIHSDNPESIMNGAWPSGYKEDFLKE